jgi:hypothetical protein
LAGSFPSRMACKSSGARRTVPDMAATALLADGAGFGTDILTPKLASTASAPAVFSDYQILPCVGVPLGAVGF